MNRAVYAAGEEVQCEATPAGCPVVTKVLFGFLAGALSGLGSLVAFWISPALGNHLRPLLTALATPVAHAISWVTGLPLHQEAAIAVYLVAIPLTMFAYGGALGAIGGAALSLRRQRSWRDVDLSAARRSQA